MAPSCKRCGKPHFNFQACQQAAENQRFKEYAVGIDRMSGQSWHGKPVGENIQMMGDVPLVKSGLPPLRTGKLTYPKESQ